MDEQLKKDLKKAYRNVFVYILIKVGIHVLLAHVIKRALRMRDEESY